MKHPWTAYVIVALLAIGAGVAVAGLPDDAPVEATIVPPSTTEGTSSPTTAVPDPDATVAPEPDSTDRPTTTIADSSLPDTSEPDTSAPDTSAPDTSEPDTSDNISTELPDRGELVVVVANGAGVAGAAARNIVRLTEAGYADLTPRDGIDTIEFTMVYYADGFDDAALRLADDLDLLSVFVAPLADAPEVIDLPDDTELLAYIGIDRA